MMTRRLSRAIRIVIVAACGATLLCTRVERLASQGSTERFEIASLRRGTYACSAFSFDERPCPPPRPTWLMLPGGRLEVTDQLAIDLIRVAFQLEHVDPKFVSGGPGWLQHDRYDVIGLTGADGLVDATVAEISHESRSLLKALLIERFKLRTRMQPMKLQVMVLERADTQALPTRSPHEDCDDPATALPTAASELREPPCALRLDAGELDVRGASMGTFAELLAHLLAVPVVDESGLSGKYDLRLQWNGPVRSRDGSPTPFVNNVLRGEGLELRRAKRPIDALVIESAEKPDEDR
jgi:uncharacterized protein (TIGR03435 family)